MAQAVGARIRQLRQKAGFSFDAFVGTAELGRGYVSELERGLAVPSLTTLAKVAAALDLTIADLVITGDTPRERLFELTEKLTDDDIEALLTEARRRAKPLAGSQP